MVGLRTDTSAPVSSRCRSWRSATLSSKDMSSFALSRCAPMPLTLPPAQKASPAPVSSRAPTAGFSPQARIIVRSAGVSASESELRASGRFSVMMATRSRMTQRSSWVPVSMVVSVVMASPFLRHCVPTGPREARPDDRLRETIQNLPWGQSGLPRRFAPRNDGCCWLGSKLLHPGSQLQLPAPGAARLLQHIPVALRDRVGSKHRIRLVRRFASRGTPDAAVDDEMRDMDA